MLLDLLCCAGAHQDTIPRRRGFIWSRSRKRINAESFRWLLMLNSVAKQPAEKLSRSTRNQQDIAPQPCCSRYVQNLCLQQWVFLPEGISKTCSRLQVTAMSSENELHIMQIQPLSSSMLAILATYLPILSHFKATSWQLRLQRSAMGDEAHTCSCQPWAQPTVTICAAEGTP